VQDTRRRRDEWDDDDENEARAARLGTLLRVEASPQAADDTQFSNAIELSEEQDRAAKLFYTWLDAVIGFPERVKNQPVFTTGGYAGTGKTTLLGFIAAQITRRYRVAFCTFTGKAAAVLARSLRANGVRPEYCGTIHRMMYIPVVDEETGVISGWAKAPELDYDLIVVDEASMLSAEILVDMKSYGIPIFAVGDHGQLPPVGEDVGIMQNLNARLDTVRRQALDNPIVALSVAVRRGLPWRDFIKYSDDPRLQYVPYEDINALIMSRFTAKDFVERSPVDDPLLLCGTNKTRAALNKAARFSLKTEETLVVGDRIMCLKNAYLGGDMMLANGFRGRVKGFGYSPNPLQLKVHADFPDEGLELRDGVMAKAQFGADKTFRSYKEINEHITSWNEAGMLFDYGNALTVHKAQASQSDEVIGVIERFQGSEEEFRRWLYTLFTRAVKKLSASW
jgi:exodeoxyribonuclease V